MGCLVLPAAIGEDSTLCVVLIILGGIFYGMCSSNMWAITQTLAGPTASGKWTGLAKRVRKSGRRGRAVSDGMDRQ